MGRYSFENKAQYRSDAVRSGKVTKKSAGNQSKTKQKGRTGTQSGSEGIVMHRPMQMTIHEGQNERNTTGEQNAGIRAVSGQTNGNGSLPVDSPSDGVGARDVSGMFYSGNFLSSPASTSPATLSPTAANHAASSPVALSPAAPAPAPDDALSCDSSVSLSELSSMLSSSPVPSNVFSDVESMTDSPVPALVPNAQITQPEPASSSSSPGGDPISFSSSTCSVQSSVDPMLPYFDDIINSFPEGSGSGVGSAHDVGSLSQQLFASIGGTTVNSSDSVSSNMDPFALVPVPSNSQTHVFQNSSNVQMSPSVPIHAQENTTFHCANFSARHATVTASSQELSGLDSVSTTSNNELFRTQLNFKEQPSENQNRKLMLTSSASHSPHSGSNRDEDQEFEEVFRRCTYDPPMKNQALIKVMQSPDSGRSEAKYRISLSPRTAENELDSVCDMLDELCVNFEGGDLSMESLDKLCQESYTKYKVRRVLSATHKISRVCSHRGRNGFSPHKNGSCSVTETPFLTKGLTKSLCDFTGTIFVQCENPVVKTQHKSEDSRVSTGMILPIGYHHIGQKTGNSSCLQKLYDLPNFHP